MKKVGNSQRWSFYVVDQANKAIMFRLRTASLKRKLVYRCTCTQLPISR
jgi:hypothetical protein